MFDTQSDLLGMHGFKNCQDNQILALDNLVQRQADLKQELDRTLSTCRQSLERCEDYFRKEFQRIQYKESILSPALAGKDPMGHFLRGIE